MNELVADHVVPLAASPRGLPGDADVDARQVGESQACFGVFANFYGLSEVGLDPFSHLLFFAAWPMLATCIALYLLRDLDTRWTVA